MIIDRNSVVPMYKQIAEHLRKSINDQTYEVGEQLPTEPELMEYYKVSRITIRKAINILVQDDLIKIQRGKGMFVNAPTIETDVLNDVMNVEDFKQFYDTLIDKGIDVQVKFLHIKKSKPPAHVARSLSCSPDEELYMVSRMFHVKDLPIAYNTAFVSPYIPIDYNILNNIENISYRELFQEYFGINEIRCALKINHTPEKIAEKLNLPPNCPLLTLSRTFIDSNGTAFVTSLIYLASNSYEFTIKL